MIFPPVLPRLARIFLALALPLTACDGEAGVTPSCEQDVSESGHLSVEGGCNPFAICTVDGQQRPPEECCKAFGGESLELCLYAYGQGSPSPGPGAGGSGGADGGAGGAGGIGGAGGS